MGAKPERNSARVLAPIALALFALVFLALILSSGSGDTKKNDGAAVKRPSTTTGKGQPRTPTPSTYTIKSGDNLPAIARATGVSAQKIQELNPALDPYNMQAGQKVKLRE